MTTRKPLLIPPWLAAVAAFAYFAKQSAPLGWNDDATYQVWYWFVISASSLAFIVAGVAIIGKERLKSAVVLLSEVVTWPRPATRLEVVLLATAIVSALGAIPHIRYMFKSGSGGTPPFSRIQSDVMAYVLRPFLEHMSQEAHIWEVCALVIGFWLVLGVFAGVALTPVVRRVRLSPIGTSACVAIATELMLVALRIVSPLNLPF